MIEFVKQVFWSICYYSFLVLFILGTMVFNLFAFIAMPLLSEQRLRSILRRFAYQLFNFYLNLMEASGALITNRNILRNIDAAKGGLLIVANHPSIVDAPIVFSRIHGLLCVFKSSLNKSLWISRTAKLVGHLSNDGGLDLMKDLSTALERGEKVLLFPEGTRTVSDGVDAFNPGYALAALRSKVPVQLIRIHSDTPILSKKQSKLRTTRFPCTFLIELGPTIEPGRHNQVRTLNHEVETWYQSNLERKCPAAVRYLPALDDSLSGTDAYSCTFTVPKDPFYCRGHMPGDPIVPGYVQMIWLRELVQSLTGNPDLRLKHFRWKFLKPVLPQDTLSVRFGLADKRNKVVITKSDEPVTQGSFTIAGDNAE